MIYFYLKVNKLLNKELRKKLKNKKKKDPLNIYKYIDKIVEKLKKYDSEIVLKKMGGNVPHPDIYGNENNYMLGGGVPHPNIYNENHMENVDFFSSDSDLDKGIIRQGGNICNCSNCKILGGCNKCKSGGCQKISGGYSSDQLLFAIEQNIKLINRYDNHVMKKIIYDENTRQITKILESPVTQITIPKLPENLEILFNSLNINDRNIESLKMRTEELINEYNRELMNIKKGGNKNNQKLEKKIIEYIKTKDLKMKVNMIKEISKKINKKIIYHINDINEKNKILKLK